MAEIEANMDTISFPFLVCHGSLDKVIRIQGSYQLFETAISQDKSLKVSNYPVIDRRDMAAELCNGCVEGIRRVLSRPAKGP